MIARIYIAVNKINGKPYIGFTSHELKYRQKGHKHEAFVSLTTYKFHRALRKYGWDAFEWSTLYESQDPLHCLNVMESHFIAEYDSYRNGYNSTTGGESGFGNTHTDKWCQNHADTMSKEWVVMDPAGNIYEIKNLHKFCKENNLALSKAANKTNIKQSKGWQVRRVGDLTPFLHPKDLQDYFLIKNINNGTQIKVDNIYKFCQDNRLDIGNLRHTISGRCKHHKGWCASKIKFQQFQI